MDENRKKSRRNQVAPPLTRRRFLVEGGKSVALASGILLGGYLVHSERPVIAKAETILTLPNFRVPPSPLYPSLVAVRGQDVLAMARLILDRLGGVGRFIGKGDKVLIKPNVGWDRQPEQAANTGPELVSAVVRLCVEAGAAKVWVSDVSINDPHRSFSRSGIEAATLHAGGEVRFPGSADFVKTDMKGDVLGVWPVCRFFHEADKVINLPIAKHHSLSRCTLAMKNWYGVIGGQRNQLHQNIHPSIVDLAAAVRPTLTIMDATRVLKANGPTGGSLADVALENTLIGSLDEVALDSYALRFFDLEASDVAFLGLAEKRGLGVIKWQDINHLETQLG